MAPVSGYLDTSEILVHGSASWVNSARLPSTRSGLRGATLNNKIIMIGNS